MTPQRFTIPESNSFEPWTLLGSFLGVFFLSVLVLSFIGFIPEEPQTAADVAAEAPEVIVSGGSGTAAQNAASATAALSYAESNDPNDPVRIIIDKVKIDMPVNNPESTNVTVLDDSLLSGAVRYPGSARFGENGTMFLFGHSSYLPVVHNKAFRAFNDVQNLVPGDVIRVQSARVEYVYRVTEVKKENLAEAYVALEKGERKLVLATCDSFGKTSDRYIVTAVFVAEYPL